MTLISPLTHSPDFSCTQSNLSGIGGDGSHSADIANGLTAVSSNHAIALHAESATDPITRVLETMATCSGVCSELSWAGNR